MKIYLIDRNDTYDYDEYDAAVVIAESPEQAVQILKDNHHLSWYEPNKYSGWGNMDVTVTEIGTANSIYHYQEIVLESFNAG